MTSQLNARLQHVRQEQPERVAWIVLLSAFSLFCFLAMLIPALLYWYVISASTPIATEITSVRGTVLVDDSGAELSSSLTDGNTTTIEESYTVSTDDTSQAILTFADDSSLTMYSNTSVVLREMQEPRFGISSNPTRIAIDLHQGRIRVTSARGREDLQFDIYTPYATIELDQGSFSIDMEDDEVQVTSRLGEAVVKGAGQTVTLEEEQRAVVKSNILQAPLPAAQDLLEGSGFFTPAFRNRWEVYDIKPIEGMTTTVKIVDFDRRNVLVLASAGEDNVHTETGVQQEVNKDVRDFQSLRVFTEVRLVDQSLPGGGHLGSEFPIMLHIAYKDAEGNDRDWFHGFYYEPPPDNFVLYDQPDNSSERIARYIWYPYESVNLLTTLGPAKPVFIKSIRIYSSGWLYESMVANISLLAQE
jgi:ferric-dicitrate binding protein FerR (iron transport regulator)